MKKLDIHHYILLGYINENNGLYKESNRLTGMICEHESLIKTPGFNKNYFHDDVLFQIKNKQYKILKEMRKNNSQMMLANLNIIMRIIKKYKSLRKVFIERCDYRSGDNITDEEIDFLITDLGY